MAVRSIDLLVSGPRCSIHHIAAEAFTQRGVERQINAQSAADLISEAFEANGGGDPITGAATVAVRLSSEQESALGDALERHHGELAARALRNLAQAWYQAS